MLVIDHVGWKLNKLFGAHPLAGGNSWRASSGAIFDLSSHPARLAG